MEFEISEGTVKTHLWRVFRKLGVRNRSGVVKFLTPVLGLLLLAILTSSSLAAQPAVFVTGPSGMQRAGSTVTLGVSISGTAGMTDQALQFSLPISWPTTATAATVATNGKQVSCATVGAILNCIVYGLNSSALTDGLLVTLSVAIPRNAGGGLSLTPFGLVAATTDASGNVTSASVVAGTPFALGITSACDLNADGKVDNGDALLLISQILGAAACASAFDLDSNGKCDAVDLQIVANAASGGKCAAK